MENYEHFSNLMPEGNTTLTSNTIDASPLLKFYLQYIFICVWLCSLKIVWDSSSALFLLLHAIINMPQFMYCFWHLDHSFPIDDNMSNAAMSIFNVYFGAYSYTFSVGYSIWTHYLTWGFPKATSETKACYFICEVIPRNESEGQGMEERSRESL